MKTILILLALLVGCGRDKIVHVASPEVIEPKSCFAEEVDGGVMITCSDEEFFISDGRDGADGEDGHNGEDADVEFVPICPAVGGNSIETLIFLDGQYLAILVNSSWKKNRLTVLEEDTLYQTTDGRNVQFKIVDEDIQCL